MRKGTITEIVKNPEWQRLRAGLVGTWKETPVQSLNKLKAYLGDLKNVHGDSPKFRRVYNYLTGSGFRIGKISHPAIDAYLTRLRRIRAKSKAI